MNKKLLSLLLLVTAAFTTAFAQEELTVYDGTKTSGYVPTEIGYWDDFTRAQFVIPAADLTDMVGGTITAIKFYTTTQNVPYSSVSSADVYLMEVGYTSISAFEPKSSASIVYQGTINIVTNSDATGGEMTLEFVTPFVYEGGNLLIGMENTTDAGYKFIYFYGQTVQGASVEGHNSSGLDNVTASQQNFIPKTTFTYTPSGGVVYSKPTNLVVSDITPNSAKLTWTPGSTETEWNVEYKKANDEEWTQIAVSGTPELVLEALTNGVTYEVRVQANYGEGNLSGWLSGSFKTLFCDAEDMGQMTYSLSDSYGDGWNGAAINVVNAATGEVVDILTISTGGKDVPITGTVEMCLGATYNFIWVPGNYPSECSFTLTDPYGDVIFTCEKGGAPAAGVFATYTYELISCPRPTNLAAENIVYNSATITWTPGNEEQDAWEIVYGVGEVDPATATPVAVSGEASYTLTGLTENTAYSVYVRSKCSDDDVSDWTQVFTFVTPLQFPIPTELTISDITATTAKASWAGNAESYNLRYRPINKGNYVLDESFEAGIPTTWALVDADGDGNNWASVTLQGSGLDYYDGPIVAGSQSYNNSAGALTPDNWLITPQVTLGGKLHYAVTDAGFREKYAVYVSTTGTNPDDFTAIKDETETTLGWTENIIDLSAYEGQQGYIAFRHFNCTDGNFLLLDKVTIGIDAPESEWTTVENATSPYDMEGLTPGTQYEVQVQGVYAEGNSDWTESVIFTTEDGLDVPTELVVDDITDKSAVASWEGIQDTYNLRYRTPASADVLFFESFEEGLGNWTLVDTDDDGNNWMQFNPLTFSSGGFPAYDGQYVVMTRSWMNQAALTPDQWLISPKIDDLGGMLRYFVMDDGSYPETYRIYVSTTDTEIENFTAVTDNMQSPLSQLWTEVAVDLSSYAGQAGYIAFRHYECTDKDFMLIDAVGLYKNEVPAGDWIVVEGITSPYTIEGLEPATNYEVEVQGILGENVTAWTAPVQFTTLEPEPEFSEFFIVGDFNEWNQTEEGGRVELVANEEGTEYTATLDFEAGQDFKVITHLPDVTPTSAAEWVWLGAAENNMIGNDLLDVNIPLLNDLSALNFKMEEAGNYTVTVKAAPTTSGLMALQEPLVMVVTKNVPPAPEYSEFYVVGDFNEWNQTEEGGRVELVGNEEGTEYTGSVEMQAEQKFKVITPNPNPTNDDDQWIWFGGADENDMGYFLINNDMLNVDISLIDGANFQVQAGGEYTITVKAAQADGTRAVQEPLVMVVTMKPTAITTISSDMNNDNAWYGINGIRYENRPTAKGVYIHNGKKVVIK